VIDRHYDDQLNQAVGRNRGFRLSDKRSTTTQVITSPRLWQKVLRNRQNRPQVSSFTLPPIQQRKEHISRIASVTELKTRIRRDRFLVVTMRVRSRASVLPNVPLPVPSAGSN
jgi:hypothetical protein